MFSHCLRLYVAALSFQMKLSLVCYVGAADLIPLKEDCIYSVPLGEAKRGAREGLSRAARLSLPARPRETCARSWAPSEQDTGSAAPEAPRTFPQTSGCRSKDDHWSHPPTVPNLKPTRRGRRWMERGRETEEAKGSKVPLPEGGQGPEGSLGMGCPRWCAPSRGDSNTPVHSPGQHAPPIPLGQGRKESRRRGPRGETLRCFGVVVLH